jgi:hypothetical protein
MASSMAGGMPVDQQENEEDGEDETPKKNSVEELD